VDAATGDPLTTVSRQSGAGMLGTASWGWLLGSLSTPRERTRCAPCHSRPLTPRPRDYHRRTMLRTPAVPASPASPTCTSLSPGYLCRHFVYCH
jgi:hypothetical protein